MSSQYGHKLDPYRKLRKPLGIKGERRTLYNTHVPSTINEGGILTVRFPDLGKNDVIVPGTSKLSFKIELASTADANRNIVNNLGRAIVSKIEIKLEGQSVFTLNDSDIYFCYTDLWKTTKERENAAYQGINSEAVRKIRINAGDKDVSNAKNKAVGETYSNLFSIPLDFELLNSHMPFFQNEFKDRLSYELTFNDYSKVVVASGNAANNTNYTISDIHLEFETITSPELATSLKNQLKGRFAILYDRIVRHSKLSLDKSDTIWNIPMAPQAKSMKGILMLFVEPQSAFARDSESFYNPKMSKVSVTLDGNPNQLFAAGMKKHQAWDEIRKHFSDGRQRSENVSGVAKELELSDVSLPDYLTTKYGLWLDMRSTDDDMLHGSGRKLEGSSQNILIQIEKETETAENLDCYVYYIQDAQLNFENGRLVSTVY